MRVVSRSSSLLVVILIIGILAAIAIPSFLSQKSKAYDSSAKTVAQTAQTTAGDVLRPEHGGSYVGVTTTASSTAIEPSLNSAVPTNANRSTWKSQSRVSADGSGTVYLDRTEYASPLKAANTKRHVFGQ